MQNLSKNWVEVHFMRVSLVVDNDCRISPDWWVENTNLASIHTAQLFTGSSSQVGQPSNSCGSHDAAGPDFYGICSGSVFSEFKFLLCSGCRRDICSHETGRCCCELMSWHIPSQKKKKSSVTWLWMRLWLVTWSALCLRCCCCCCCCCTAPEKWGPTSKSRWWFTEPCSPRGTGGSLKTAHLFTLNVA